MRTKLFLESTQNQRCFNVEFYRWINVDRSTLNQRGYHVDQRRDVISTYINAESTLSVCWVWPVWKNGWMFIYELCGCEFKSCCSNLTYRYRACFEQSIPLLMSRCKDHGTGTKHHNSNSTGAMLTTLV